MSASPPMTVVVRKVDGWGRERRASLPPTSPVSNSTAPPTVRTRCACKPSDRAYALGEFLTPSERETFARRLDQALLDARRERHEELNE